MAKVDLTRRRERGVVRVHRQATRVLHSMATAPPNNDADLVATLRAACTRVLDPPLIAVLVPVLQRPHRVQSLVDSFRDATPVDDARLYFVAQRSDVAEVAAIRNAGLEPILVDDEDRSWAKKINRGYLGTVEPWMLLGADDLQFHRGWVDKIRGLLHSHPGVIGTNDLGNPTTRSGSHSTHPLVRRLYATICGTADERCKVLHEGYDHNYPDTELVATARARDLWVHAADCVIEHLHPLWGKGSNDPVYALGQRRMHEDRALFMSRSARFRWPS